MTLAEPAAAEFSRSADDLAVVPLASGDTGVAKATSPAAPSDDADIDRAILKEAYASVLGEAGKLQSQYMPDIRDKARTLDARKVLALVRGA